MGVMARNTQLGVLAFNGASYILRILTLTLLTLTLTPNHASGGPPGAASRRGPPNPNLTRGAIGSDGFEVSLPGLSEGSSQRGHVPLTRTYHAVSSAAFQIQLRVFVPGSIESARSGCN